MSGASDTLDPIAAAEAGIAGSKDLMAAVARELGQHQRWLAHYRLAEKRHARRLMLQALIDRLERGRRRLMRWAKRLALISLRSARSVADFLSRTATALLLALHRFVVACFVWLRSSAYALARMLWGSLTALGAFILGQSRILARAAVTAASIGFTWLAAQSRALAFALQRWLSALGTWALLQAGRFAAQSRALAAALLRRLSALGAWALLHSVRLARASLTAAAIGSSWLAAQSWALAAALHRRLSALGARDASPRRQARAHLPQSRRHRFFVGRNESAGLAHGLHAVLSAAAAGTSARAQTFARASVAGASSGLSWSVQNARSFAHGLHGVLSAAAAGTSARAQTFARASVAGASSGLSWSVQNARGFSHGLQGVLSAAAAGTSTRAQTFARASVAGASSGLSWSVQNARGFSHGLHGVLSAAAAGTSARAQTFARASVAGASSGLSWSVQNARGFSHGLHGVLSAAAAGTSTRAQTFARASVAGASSGFSWAVQNARRILQAAPDDRRSAAHRALVVRRSTALIRFEPKRAGLPAHRAG